MVGHGGGRGGGCSSGCDENGGDNSKNADCLMFLVVIEVLREIASGTGSISSLLIFVSLSPKAQHTTLHSTAQHSTAQHSTVQHTSLDMNQ